MARNFNPLLAFSSPLILFSIILVFAKPFDFSSELTLTLDTVASDESKDASTIQVAPNNDEGDDLIEASTKLPSSNPPSKSYSKQTKTALFFFSICMAFLFKYIVGYLIGGADKSSSGDIRKVPEDNFKPHVPEVKFEPHEPQDKYEPHEPQDKFEPHEPQDKFKPHVPEDTSKPHVPEDTSKPHVPEDIFKPRAPEHIITPHVPENEPIETTINEFLRVLVEIQQMKKDLGFPINNKSVFQLISSFEEGAREIGYLVDEEVIQDEKGNYFLPQRDDQVSSDLVEQVSRRHIRDMFRYVVNEMRIALRRAGEHIVADFSSISRDLQKFYASEHFELDYNKYNAMMNALKLPRHSYTLNKVALRIYFDMIPRMLLINDLINDSAPFLFKYISRVIKPLFSLPKEESIPEK